VKRVFTAYGLRAELVLVGSWPTGTSAFPGKQSEGWHAVPLCRLQRGSSWHGHLAHDFRNSANRPNRWAASRKPTGERKAWGEMKGFPPFSSF